MFRLCAVPAAVLTVALLQSAYSNGDFADQSKSSDNKKLGMHIMSPLSRMSPRTKGRACTRTTTCLPRALARR